MTAGDLFRRDSGCGSKKVQIPATAQSAFLRSDGDEGRRVAGGGVTRV